MSQRGASRCALDSRIGIEAPSVSWLGGSIVERGLPIPAPIRGIRISERNSGARPAISALQSRGGDGFSPSSRARSLGNCERRAKPAQNAGCMRRGNFASSLCCLLFPSLCLLPYCSSNSNFKSQMRNLITLGCKSEMSNLKSEILRLKHSIGRPNLHHRKPRYSNLSPLPFASRSRTRGFPPGRISTSSGAANTSSRISR